MKRTIGLALVLVCCLSSQVYAGVIGSAAKIAIKAHTVVKNIKTPGALYSQKKINGTLYKIQESLYVSEKIPVYIERTKSKIVVESHGKTSFIDMKALGGEVLDFRITSRSKNDVRVALKVLDKNGKLDEIHYVIKGEEAKITGRSILQANKDLVQFRVAEVVSSPSTSWKDIRASGVK